MWEGRKHFTYGASDVLEQSDVRGAVRVPVCVVVVGRRLLCGTCVGV